MAPEKHDLAATRERLEFLLEKDGGNSSNDNGDSPSPGSTRQAFLAGAAFSGLVAASIFLTGFIDSKLHESEAVPQTLSGATNGALGPSNAISSKIAAGDSPAGFMSDNTRERRVQNVPVLNGAPNAGITPILSRDVARHNLGDTHAIPVAIPTPPKQTPVDQALVPVAGLSTSRSVITGVADPQTMTASYYWTFTLKNQTASSKEAQMNIALPNGAVVSRATLWINGRAEEAAFNTTSQVQNAYDWIVSRNRDPLLITQTADGNINLKASPVMPKKEMKIRIGITTPMQMTADGKSQMELPHIIDANLDFNCLQNVHITSEEPLVSNDTRMNSPAQKKGFLLRGNVNAGDLQKLQVIAQRDPNMAKFATRATHSNPPSYIVAELQQDNQGLSTLKLTKSLTKPDCLILKDDHAAFRLSYLWVKKEIERLTSIQDTFQAEELATVYRVVSPVSGAVVLERQTDYDYNGLDRNMYKSLAYEPSQSQDDESVAAGNANGYANFQSSQPAMEVRPAAPAPKASAAPSAVAPAATPMPVPSASFDKSSGKAFDARPIVSRRQAKHASSQAEVGTFREANKIALMPTETKTKEKVSGRMESTRSAQSNPIADIISHGSSTRNAATGSYSDAGSQGLPSNNSFNTQGIGAFSDAASQGPPSDGAQEVSSSVIKAVRLAGPAGYKLGAWASDANMLFLSHPISTAALLSLLGLTFGGGFALYAIAAQRLYRRQSGAVRFAVCGALWFVVAAVFPLFSQVFTVMLAAGLALRAVLKAPKADA